MNTDFINALLGGGLIGLSAFALLFFVGKVCGISGIVGSAITGVSGLWRWAFIVGMLIAGFIMSPLDIETAKVADTESFNTIILAIAGLIVGFGTTLGSGCTSGHGIVGLGRFSKRSLVATCTFMGSAMVTVFIIGVL